MLRSTDRGLYCEAGGFYVDPWETVELAVVTHAHWDHARPGCEAYLTAEPGEALLRERLGPEVRIQSVPYGHRFRQGAVEVSLHPAGHILGSAQVRLESRGEVWVVSGDYKRQPDPTCAPFEPLRCHTFVTEATFGLPVFRWPPQEQVFGEIHHWWRDNQQSGRSSILFVYSLGKAQRVLAGLDPAAGPLVLHESVARYLPAYEADGLRLLPSGQTVPGPTLALAPPSAAGSAWLRGFGEASTGFVSGWMQIRGKRRRRSVDRGFVLSDHADWPALLATIRETGAENVAVTNGYAAALARWLAAQGRKAWVLETRRPADSDPEA